MKIQFPSIFSDHNRIEALFTESNRYSVNVDGDVPGLNLGYNTAASSDEVNQNFEMLFSTVGWKNPALALANQVHGSHIEVVDSPGTYDNTDGLITKTINLTIGIRVADCAAVLIADPLQGILGAFHAGWKGAADGIIPKGIDLMRRQGGDPEFFYVYISPCISLKNFEVGEEVAVQFPEQFIVRHGFEKPHVDLSSFLMYQIKNEGVPASHIQESGDCTVENKHFFSFRREREKAGRMLASIKLNE